MSFTHYRVGRDLQVPEMAGTVEPALDKYLEQLANIEINILSNSFDEIVFDLIGVEAPIANALRRIMLAEV